MLKKVKWYLYKILYSLPFGLKGADMEIFGKNDSVLGNGIVIQQENKQNNLGENLLQGEVTQEVEELRYSTYKVAQEAQKYRYLGDGVAIRDKGNDSETIIQFRNGIICEGVGHELKRVNDYSIDRYVLKVKYSDIPRYRLEKYCNNVKVDLKNKFISLYIEKNTNNPELRMFFNELDKICNGLKSEITDYPTEFSFVTEDTFKKYALKGIKFNKLESEQFQYVISYKFRNYEMIDIVQTFYSESQDEKYKNKERKTNVIAMDNNERKSFCSMCGKEINNYDSDITTKTYGYPLCQECLEKVSKIKGEIE